MRVHYTLSRKTTHSGMSEVLVRVTEGNSAWRGKTGVLIRRDLWDEASGYPSATKRVHSDRLICDDVSSRLEAITDRLCSAQSRSDGWLSEAISCCGSSDLRLMRTDEAIMAMVERAYRSGSIGESSYVTYKRNMVTFRKAIDIAGISPMASDFDGNAFNKVYEAAGTIVSLNYVKHLMTIVVTYWRRCCDECQSLAPLRNKVRVGDSVYGTPYYLTRQQRDDVLAIGIGNARLAAERDKFVLQCLTGCRSSDLYSLTYDNIRDGNLVYVARKTARSAPKTITVPLHPVAVELIERLKSDNRKTLVPYSTLYNYNNAIRRIIKMVPSCHALVPVRDRHTGITAMKPLYEVASSHMARRTFIGCLYEAGFRESDICSLSGHTEGSASIRRYRSVSTDIKRRMIDSL